MVRDAFRTIMLAATLAAGGAPAVAERGSNTSSLSEQIIADSQAGRNAGPAAPPRRQSLEPEVYWDWHVHSSI